MLPEQITQDVVASTAVTDIAAKSPELTTNNIGDNIITISSSGYTENALNTTSSVEIVAEKIKAHKIYHQTSSKIVQLLSKGNTQQHNHQININDVTTTTTTTTNNSKSCCCKLSKYISQQENIADVHHRKGRRLHGLQLPLHPLQICGWLVLILFGLASYYVLIPAFNIDVQGPLYGLISGLYIVHVVSHLAALLIDPADRELRRVHRNDRIVPEFDRSKHTHVIENGRCHLCNIRCSSQRTKHCSVCNKCVGKFDHHCKWLNHCIGSRNYVAFLMCVVSAVIATLIIVAAVTAQLVLHCVQPQWLSIWFQNTTGNAAQQTSTLQSVAYNQINVNETDAELSLNVTQFYMEDLDLENATLTSITDNLTSSLYEKINETVNSTAVLAIESTTQSVLVAKHNSSVANIAGIGVSTTIFFILLGILGLLAAITAGLLLHLCFFHIYISFLGLTTYEYIRNHRQAQEAKAKLNASNVNGTQQPSDANNTPSKKTNNCGQIYFCSSLQHPNTMDTSDLRYFDTRKPVLSRDDDQASKLHCCNNSREYHQTALKTYYMCSLLEENVAENRNFGGHLESPAETDSNIKTFHCCSSFAATTTQRKVSAATSKATLVTNLEAADVAAATANLSARRSYLKFTEQCTFCTYSMRSPLPGKCALNSSSSSSGLHSACSQEDCPNSLSSSAEHQQRCCLKAISKQQRWRRKWNCCSSVPDSPDVPNDIITSISLRQQQEAKSISATEIPIKYVKSINGTDTAINNCTTRPTSPRNMRLKTRQRNSRTWPVTHLRHIMRTLSRYRRPNCRLHNAVASSSLHAGEILKQNQVRPLQLSNGCQHQFQPSSSYYDSSSPQPASTTTTERSSDPSIYSDSSNLNTPNTIETILPTSVIRDNTAMTYTMTLPPALPPPTRRKIANPTDLDELAETLGFVSSSTANVGIGLTSFSSAQRLPIINNAAYRRQRRKHFLRTRSPTLSPIHESGLSNPTSPQPCRHQATSISSGVNKLCGSMELVRKTSSNSSLHSISSNSSST